MHALQQDHETPPARPPSRQVTTLTPADHAAVTRALAETEPTPELVALMRLQVDVAFER
jgi:hypothetical protein